MINELNEIMVGFDLCCDYSQLTFYIRNNTEPITVSTVQGEKQYQIPTPKDLFSLIEQGAELGEALLSNFFKECFGRLAGVGIMTQVHIAVSMERMKAPWPDSIVGALEMLGIPREQVYLQSHLESFYYYMLNQRKELWNYQVAMFEYKDDSIIAYEMNINYRTKPAFVTVKQVSKLYLDAKARDGQKENIWNQTRDELFLNQAQKMFRDKVFSSAYLIGEGFSQQWAQESLQFLCKHRHVFQGSNLFTKGACYSAMERAGAVSIGAYLFAGEDMVEHNIGMVMKVRGTQHYYNMVSAGISCYTAHHECEFLLDDTEDIVIYSRSMSGEEMSHTVTLTDLPVRPNRATRIYMKVTFPSRNKCYIRMEDLGMGEFYPSTGKKWEATIALQEERTT